MINSKDEFPNNKNNDEKEYCIPECKLGRKNSNLLMICCDNCGSWYHTSCVGVVGDSNTINNMEEWFCPICQKKENDKDINIIFRRITKYPINNQKSSYGEYKSLSDNYNNKTKMPEYYQMNLDRYGKYPFSCGEKIDGFTMKTIKGNKSTIDMLSDYEKHIFLSKLD